MPARKKARTETGFDVISPDDIMALSEFLDREPHGERSMSIEMVDGFLTAIVIGPEMVMPSQYLPWIWDWKRGKKDVEFGDPDEANRIVSYLQGMNNRVAGPLMSQEPTVMPLFMLDPTQDHLEWQVGFAMGAEFDKEIWDYASEKAPELFAPISALALVKREDKGWAPACINLIRSLVLIRDYFRTGDWRQEFEEVQKPFVRQGPKIGRNDPCPCGSGRKFKKCCGETGGVVH